MGRRLYPQEFSVFEEILGRPVRQVLKGSAFLLRLSYCLVFDVGEVEDALHLIAQVLQVSMEDILIQEGPVVPYVGPLVDGGAAGEHLDLLASQGLEGFLLP